MPGFRFSQAFSILCEGISLPQQGRILTNAYQPEFAPTADAGPDQTVDEGDTVTLDGSNSSDTDGDVVAYRWTQTAGAPLTLSDATAAQPTFAAPDVGPDGESLTFQLTVTDDGGLQDTDTCIVNVSWAVPSEVIIEIGEIDINHNWVHVSFDKPFFDPIVVAKLVSHHDTDPCVVRVRNVDGTGFDVRIQEWDYLDGIHAEETVSYIVMERGSYTLSDGTMVEAGRFDIENTGSFKTVTFDQAFQIGPVVIASVSSFNEEDAVTGRMRNIALVGFEFAMQEQELNAKVHAVKTISYIAWEPSLGTLNGLTFEVNETDDVMTQDFREIAFEQSFEHVPAFFADLQTTDGSDTAGLRVQDRDFFSAQVKIEEEQSMDTETGHTTEVVGYIVFEELGQ